MTFWSRNNVEPVRKYRFKLGNKWWWAKSVSKPSFDIAVEEYLLINHKIKYPGVVTWNDIEIVIVDFIDENNKSVQARHLYETFEGRKSYNYDFNGLNNEGFSKKIMIDGVNDVMDAAGFIIEQFDANGNRIDKWTLINPMIKSVNFGQLEYSSDDLLEISMTVAYDSAKFEQN